MLAQGSAEDILAQFYGLFLVATGLGILLSGPTYARMIDGLRSAPMLGYLAGIGTFATGMVTLSLYSSWSGGVHVTVTVIGWLALVEGLLLMAVPGPFLDAVSRLPLRGAVLKAVAGAVIALGLWLLLAGLGVL